jgi:hypothetical protein
MKSLPQTGLSVAFVEDNSTYVFDCYAEHLQENYFGTHRKMSMAERWKHMRAEEKQEWCRSTFASALNKLPLFFRVAPAVRDVLWPEL